MPGARSEASFSYTGRLLREGAAVDGECDFRFGLFTEEFGGRQTGKTAAATLPVGKGRFTTTLDFGSQALEIKRPYLDISVRCPTGEGSFVQLLRQPLNGKATYDIAGFGKLARETFEREPSATEQAQTGRREDDTALEREPAPQAARLDTSGMGAKAQEVAPGHEGLKRATAMHVPAPGDFAPGEKREMGEKGVRGNDFSHAPQQSAESQSKTKAPSKSRGDDPVQAKQEQAAGPLLEASAAPSISGEGSSPATQEAPTVLQWQLAYDPAFTPAQTDTTPVAPDRPKTGKSKGKR
ncbi:MAG: hypothetical protein HY681_11645 [Chloroflexi bacterium]|nr:hypothetical protein [Chloroflexota bacterium]